MSEAIRYFNNAKEILSKSRIENGRYTDIKYVKSSLGTAYLALLEAIKEYLLRKNLTRKELPKSVEGYQNALQKYLSIHNGKLTKEFDRLYDELHIAGYYRGLLTDREIVKKILMRTKTFIDKLK